MQTLHFLHCSKLVSVTTQNHGEVRYEADNFILASGNFFSKGLVSDIDGVYEPVFGLDMDYISERPEWYKRNMFEAQPYMNFGVSTGEDFKTMKNGEIIDNLYAAGAVLSGFNALKEGSGAGISFLTALHVSSLILGGK